MTTNVYNYVTTFMNELTFDNWYYIKNSHDHIILAKPHFELDRIDVEFKNNIIHFSLPLKNSSYSFYNKFSNNDNTAVSFLKKYITHLTS